MTATNEELDKAEQSAFNRMGDYMEGAGGRKPWHLIIRCGRRPSKVRAACGMCLDNFLLPIRETDELPAGAVDDFKEAVLGPLERLSGEPVYFRLFVRQGDELLALRGKRDIIAEGIES